MERITISIDTDLAQEFDQLIARPCYRNRSEAVHSLVRTRFESERHAPERGVHHGQPIHMIGVEFSRSVVGFAVQDYQFQ